ncbi:hypothetical protein D3C78_860980 [compost metagenome]
MHLAGLTLDLIDGLADPFDQVMNLGHRAVEHVTQLTQFITAVGSERHGHVTGRHFVHDPAQAFERGAGGSVEAAVEIENQHEHHTERHRLQHHVRTVLLQALLQLNREKLQRRVVQLVGLRHQTGDLVVKTLPRCIEGVGHHHLLFEQLAGLLERGLAGIGRRFQHLARSLAGTQRILQFECIFSLQPFHLRQQFIKAGGRRGIQKALPQRERAHCPAIAEDLRDSGGDVGEQFTQLTDVALVVPAQAGLAGDDLAENLRIAEQLADHRAFALQGLLRLLGLERCDHFIALGIEHADLFRVAGHRVQRLQALQHALLKGTDLRLDIPRLAGLAEARVDLHQIVQGFQVAPQGQAAAQQVETLQFNPRPLEFTIRIAHQIEVGHQHG